MKRIPRGMRRSEPIELETTDRELAALLREDGRMSNRDLARLLNVSEGTVRTRIRRLAESNTMRVAAITDIFAAGYDLFIAILAISESFPIVRTRLEGPIVAPTGLLPFGAGPGTLSRRKSSVRT